jgi:dipeptidyl aminopeptidase/acylaminoacyl peptidase
MYIRRLACGVLLCGLAACGGEPENPFADVIPVRAPERDAALVFTSDSWSTRSGVPRELFAVRTDGGGLSRLTFCNNDQRRCDSAEISPAPDRLRAVVRRVTADANGDGRLNAADGESVLFVDLSRGAEAPLVPAAQHVSGVDWSPTGDVIVYSALGEGGHEDIYRMDPNGQNNANLTASAAVDERRPRIDPSGSTAIYERIDSTGKGRIYLFLDSLRQVAVTSGGPGTDRLAGTPYVVGSDADPDYSPDGTSAVFRRLTALGNGGLGSWDVMTVRLDGSNLRAIASGPAYRGAPDWGPAGIVFPEVDTAAGTSALVVVQGDGSGRQVPVTVGASFALSFPRWLR